MNNLNYITKAHPEYHMLKQTIAFMRKMDIATIDIEDALRERYKLNQKTMDLLFKVNYIFGYDPAEDFKSQIQGYSPSSVAYDDYKIYKRSVKFRR